MRKTLNIDEQLLRQARKMSRAKTDTATVELALQALIRHLASQELRKFAGSEPDADLHQTPRRRA